MVAYKEQIQRFYRKFAPNTPVDADKLLKKYKGSESVLLSELYVKYLLADEKGDGSGTPFKEAVTRLYARYDPNGTVDVSSVISKYQGSPDELITGIVNKYEFLDAPSVTSTAVSPKARLTEIYQAAKPEKVGEIDNLLEKYKGNENDLVKAVEIKYKPVSTSTSTSQDSFKTKITELYKKHNPGKVAMVDELAKKHMGNQATLLATIEAKYHPKRNELVSLYNKYNPNKVNDVEELLIKYKGKEEKLIEGIKTKYEGMKEVVTQTPAPSFEQAAPQTPTPKAEPVPSAPLSSTPPVTSAPEAPPAAVSTPAPTPPVAPTPPTVESTPQLAATTSPLSAVAPAKEDAAPTPPPVASPPDQQAGTPPVTTPPPSVAPEANVDAQKEADRLKAQQPARMSDDVQSGGEAEAKRIVDDEASRRVKEEADRKLAVEQEEAAEKARVDEANRKVAAEQAAKQQALDEEQKKKAAAVAAATATQKKAAAKPKENLPAGKAGKKSLVPLFMILAVVIVLGAGGGGYYYKFGFNLPFTADNTEETEEQKSDKAAAAVVKKDEPKPEPEEETPALEVPDLVIEEPEEEDVVEEIVEEEPEEEVVVEPEPEPAPKPKPAATSSPPASSGLKFHLAAGSFSSEQNARSLQRDLKSQGYDAVYLGKIGDYYKVSYQSFNNEADAKAALQSLKDKGVSSWMMRHELK